MNSMIDIFNANFALTISLYFIFLILVCLIPVFLSKLSTLLKTKAHLSDGIVAGILLGAITSFPELVTCLTSIVQNQSGAIGSGDILGSNIFDLFVLVVCLLVCVKLFVQKKVSSINTITLVCTGIGTLFCVLAYLFSDKGVIFSQSSPLVWHGFNFFSILMALSYGFSIFFIIREQRLNAKIAAIKTIDNTTKGNKGLEKLNLVSVITLLVISAILLIAVSVIFTYLSTSLIETHLKLGKNFGGSILIGIGTSLPEIVCCIMLCISKEYNMVIDTIVGSTIFNLFILVIGNIAYSCIWNSSLPEPMYQLDRDTIILLICSFISIILMILYLVLNSKRVKSNWSQAKIIGINAPILSLAGCSYIVYVILGCVLK